MNTARPFLVVFCWLHLPAYAQHITAENFVSALGFLIFLLNELHKATLHVMNYRQARRTKRAAVKPLKAPVIQFNA